jgi:hypothetical protein
MIRRMPMLWEHKILMAWGERDGQPMARDLTADPSSPLATAPLQTLLARYTEQGYELEAVMPRSIQTDSSTTTQLVYTLKRQKATS